jgi:two-component system, OmpR family, sensor histidine kinase KdpD
MYKSNLSKQYLVSLILVFFSIIGCLLIVKLTGYVVVSLILLVVVSINAILFDIYPVLISAFISAICWNFFFIPPIYTFYIGTPEDGLLFLMYFVIASINAVLTFKIKKKEKKVQIEEEKLKSIQLYNTILNSLSHELRTPISTVIGSIEIIKMNHQNLNQEQINELYNEIEIAGFRLNRQVENLLNISRIEAGFIQPKNDWCDTNELLNNIMNDLTPELELRDIKIKSSDSSYLCKIDQGLLYQILHNLIHNAIQYTPPHSSIEIEVEISNSKFKCTIEDNGPGFPENEIDLVFNKFYRLKNSKSGGTGLGLSIVKGLIEALNGEIRLKNSPKNGAIFHIEIPCDTTLFNSMLD